MKCTRCEHELPPSALFCGKCGTPVTKTVAPTPIEPLPDASVGVSAAQSAQAQQAAARIQAAKWEEQRLTLMQIQSTVNTVAQTQSSHKQDLDARIQRLSQDADERQVEMNQLLMASRNLESRLNQLQQTVQQTAQQPAGAPAQMPESLKLDAQDKTALMQVIQGLQNRIDSLSRDFADQAKTWSTPLVNQVASTGESAIDVHALLRALREGWDASWQEHVQLLNERLSTDTPAMLGGGSASVDENALAAHLSATVDASLRVALSGQAFKGPDLSGVTLEFSQIRQDLHRMASTLERVVNHQSEQTERQVQVMNKAWTDLNESMGTSLQGLQQALLAQMEQRWQEALHNMETLAQSTAKAAPAADRMQKLEPRLESRLEALFHHAPGSDQDKHKGKRKGKTSDPHNDTQTEQDVPFWLWLVLGGFGTITVALSIVTAVKLFGQH